MAWRAPANDPNAPKPRIIDFYSEDPDLTDEEAEQKRQEGDDWAGIILWGVIIFVFLWTWFWASMDG